MRCTYNGDVKTKDDAIILFEACRLDILPRVLRRLSKNEINSIKSGSVFVWMEHEAGMKRWTDRRLWSASRMDGSFLTYTEMEGTEKGRRGKTQDMEYKTKQNGLKKKSLTITTSRGQRLHIISYYSRSHQNLLQPTTDPTLRHIVPDMKIYPEVEAEGPHATTPCNKSDASNAQNALLIKPFPKLSPPYQQYQSNGMLQYSQQTAFSQRLPHVSSLPPTQQDALAIREDKRIIGVLDRNLRI